jgi:hypothetical protein
LMLAGLCRDQAQRRWTFASRPSWPPGFLRRPSRMLGRRLDTRVQVFRNPNFGWMTINYEGGRGQGRTRPLTIRR